MIDTEATIEASQQKIRDKILADLERLTYSQEQKSFSLLKLAFANITHALENLNFLANYDQNEIYEICKDMLTKVFELPKELYLNKMQSEVVNDLMFYINYSLEIFGLLNDSKIRPEWQILVTECKRLLTEAKEIFEGEYEETIAKYMAYGYLGIRAEYKFDVDYAS